MSKKILISAHDASETRVAVIDNGVLVDFDSELSSQKPIRGNIYLARVVRIEPSLQAVFVEYSEGKNGFLAFTEIHPDYYKIPADDQLQQNNEKLNQELEDEPVAVDGGADDDAMSYPTIFDESKTQKTSANKRDKRKVYKVQDVIQKKQIFLVQVIKDERGNKSAALTTYLSLAGQYCILMPNAGERNGGISKRIYKDDDRKRLKEFINDLEIPERMSVIIRTAGQECSKAEIQKDYKYLMRLWDDVRSKTLQSQAPTLINEESCVFMKSIRDFYRKDVDEILVDTKDAYKRVREIMMQLSKSSVKKVKLYKNDALSLFNSFSIEAQVLDIMSPQVDLPSGGSIVIGQTEALVAIDINSGRATKERHIDTTALKTNLEAAKEIARQIRLRDLSGLIVIDFIDMSNQKHIQQVERAFNSELLNDNAKVQVSNISQFGLLEMSRQRLRSSLAETYCETCSCCRGKGVTYSKMYFLSTILHFLEKVAVENKGDSITVYTPQSVCHDLLNKKRKEISAIEQKNDGIVTVEGDSSLSDTSFTISCAKGEVHRFSLDKSDEKEKEEERQQAKMFQEEGVKPMGAPANPPKRAQNKFAPIDRRNPFRLHRKRKGDNGNGYGNGNGSGHGAGNGNGYVNESGSVGESGKGPGSGNGASSSNDNRKWVSATPVETPETPVKTQTNSAPAPAPADSVDSGKKGPRKRKKTTHTNANLDATVALPSSSALPKLDNTGKASKDDVDLAPRAPDEKRKSRRRRSRKHAVTTPAAAAATATSAIQNSIADGGGGA
ncbi:MAG: Rne/Rng family ribonuclease [Holosporales bacterium]|jgi:ribonuclease E|nr:Rne/Rng family ribonuclease [Holosporales bacterium]